MENLLPADARCLRCGHHLFGLPQPVCPESGRHFRADDPSTFALPGKWHWPQIPTPPPEWYLALALPFTLAFIYWSSVPGGLLASLSFAVLPLGLAGLGVFFLLVLDYAARFHAIWRERRIMRAVAPSYRPLWRWLVLPALMLVVLSVMLTSWPVRVRFHFSKMYFENAANLHQAGADPRILTGDYGLYDVSYVHRYKDGSLFFQTGNAGFDKVGILFSPFDRPRRTRETRLASRWYTEMW